MTKERLKELRKEAGLTQNQVAEMIGVQGRNYQRLEITDACPQQGIYSLWQITIMSQWIIF